MMEGMRLHRAFLPDGRLLALRVFGGYAWPVYGLLVLFLAGCGSTAAQQHTQLNALTDVADPTYEMAVNGCDAARDLIVAREGTTREEDFAAMNEINEVCDAIVLSFETLRGTQLTARAAIDSGAEGAIREAIIAGLQLWTELQAKIPELETLGRTP